MYVKRSTFFRPPPPDSSRGAIPTHVEKSHGSSANGRVRLRLKRLFHNRGAQEGLRAFSGPSVPKRKEARRFKHNFTASAPAGPLRPPRRSSKVNPCVAGHPKN
jgi:hypothetical protein